MSNKSTNSSSSSSVTPHYDGAPRRANSEDNDCDVSNGATGDDSVDEESAASSNDFNLEIHDNGDAYDDETSLNNSHGIAERSSPISIPDDMISRAEHEAILDAERQRYNTMYLELSKEIRRLNDKLESLGMHLKDAKAKKSQITRYRKDQMKELGQQVEISDMVNEGPASLTIYAGGRASASRNGIRAGTSTSGSQTERNTNKHDIKWSKRFEELKEFSRAHGHCNVSSAVNKELSAWVKTQRSQHKEMCRGRRHNMTPSRIQMLSSIGFQWSVAKTIQVGFDVRFEQLQEFKEKHGHLRVPQKLEKPKGLGGFVLEQRKLYKELKSAPPGFKTSLSQERVELLNSIGFEWSLRNRGRRSMYEHRK